MWNRWAQLVIRNSWKWIIGWFIVTAAIRIPAPQIPTLLKDDAKNFLPADLPSQVALTRLREEFPDRAPASRAVIVAVRESGLTSEDWNFFAHLTTALEAQKSKQNWRISSPSASWFLKPILESTDGKCAIIVVDLPAAMLTHSTVNRVHAIEAELRIAQAPAGLDVQITGSGAMGALLDSGAKRDIDRTTLWAVAAVILILLFVYRSPVAMLLPLVTIGIALSAALGVIGWLAGWGWPINGLVQLFIIVMVLGCGTDYCLLLYARFLEELHSASASIDPQASQCLPDVSRKHALQRALAHSGGAILTGAGTVAAGLTTLALARHRDYYTSGPTIAVAIAIATFCVLTLTPSLMHAAGRSLIPIRLRHAARSNDSPGWSWAAKLVTTRPLLMLLITLLILGPLALLSLRLTPMYDSLAEFPAESSFVIGAKNYYEHFYGSPAAEVTILISTDAKLDTETNELALGHLLSMIHNRLKNEFPLARQRDLADPIGTKRQNGRSDQGILDSLMPQFGRSQIRGAYIGSSGMCTRIDAAFLVDPRSPEAMDLVNQLHKAISTAIADSGFLPTIGAHTFDVLISGESPFYADQRDMRARDVKVVSIAAIAVILMILFGLTRSIRQAIILVLATILTFAAAYGATWLIFRGWYGLPGLNWKLGFLMFVIILSLGQDYNIFVAARIADELRTHAPRDAIEIAVRRTGRVVSSCGIIMAATFAAMSAGSLVLMKEFAIALALGILIDTFIVRPLLVPSLILLTRAWPHSAPHRS